MEYNKVRHEWLSQSIVNLSREMKELDIAREAIAKRLEEVWHEKCKYDKLLIEQIKVCVTPNRGTKTPVQKSKAHIEMLSPEERLALIEELKKL